MTEASGLSLELQELTKRFGSLIAVDGVSLSVPGGEHHAVIGPNGAGKTTLFDLVTGALSPSAGRIRVDGADVTDLREDQRARRGIVRSFQLTELFEDRSIGENLRLAVQASRQTLDVLGTPDPELADKATEWLGRLEIDADPSAKPSSLSHADRKRLEVGTALATDPKILLLDEPTSGVPPGESAALIDLIGQVTAGQTVVLIEHDVDLALSFADRVTVMDRGRIIADGRPAEIVEDETVQAAYLGGFDGTTFD